jgi:hypothetical protein
VDKTVTGFTVGCEDLSVKVELDRYFELARVQTGRWV